MQNVTYDGPYEALEIPALGLTAEKGKPFKVSNEEATRLARRDDFTTEADKGEPSTNPVTAKEDSKSE